MSVHIYKTIKSPEQPFVHVHFVINQDHHIIEINDGMAKNTRLSRKDIRDAIFNNNKLKKYKFQADDEGFYTVDDMNSDIVVSGNVSDYNHDRYSQFTFEITDKDNVRSLIIKSTFNKKQVTTVIPIESDAHKEELSHMVYSMILELYSGFSEWVDACVCNSYEDEW